MKILLTRKLETVVLEIGFSQAFENKQFALLTIRDRSLLK